MGQGLAALLSVLQNQNAARQRAAMETAQLAQNQGHMDQQQGQYDQGRMDHANSLAAQLKASLLQQSMRDAAAERAQGNQADRMDAQEQWRSGRAETSEKARADREATNAATAQAFQREQNKLNRAAEMERAKLPHRSVSTVLYPDRPKPDAQGDYRKHPLWGQLQQARAALASAIKADTEGQFIRLNPDEPTAETKKARLHHAKVEKAFADHFGGVPPESDGGL